MELPHLVLFNLNHSFSSQELYVGWHFSSLLIVYTHSFNCFPQPIINKILTRFLLLFHSPMSILGDQCIKSHAVLPWTVWSGIPSTIYLLMLGMTRTNIRLMKVLKFLLDFFFALKQLANLCSLTVWWFDEIALLSSHGIHCRCFSNIWLWERLNYISEEAHCCILLTFLGFFKIAVFPVKFWICWPWIHATVVISIDMLSLRL